LPSFIRPVREMPEAAAEADRAFEEQRRREEAATAADQERKAREEAEQQRREAESRQWESVQQEVAGMLPNFAVERLRAFRGDAAPWLRERVDNEIQRFEAMIRAAEEERQTAERAAHEAMVAADMEKVVALRDRCRVELVPSRNFRAALPRVSALMLELQTDEGRAALQALQDTYQRLEDLRQIIMNGVRTDPFLESDLPELGGNARTATATGIRVELVGLQGDRTWRWAELDARLLSRLADHYIQRLPAPEQASGYLSLALLGHESGIEAAARSYAGRARQLDPSIRSEIARLLPDLNL